ncbi:MAG: shikimate kinase [Candidatus Eremiobacteraeota bacterium]|nr:shikimate kinase [Candidatus Eremiobacteraeota bacterium]
MKRHVALVGFMASGKSTIGRKLARNLNRHFVDTDALIVRAHGPIARIFSEQGEAAFRDFEHAALREALDTSEACVISLGGGALTKPENRRLLEEYADRVFIKMSPEQIFSRVLRSREVRPMLGASPTLARIQELYAKRMADYESADLIVDASHRSDADVIRGIVGWLRARDDGGRRAES